MVNTEWLKSKITSSGYKMSKIALLLRISQVSLWRKINGKTEFKPSELLALAKILNISDLREFYQK